ncbi:MAG TPA: Flp pilus assembly protein CpaB [Candidatus Ozemobacteraceae bacterium]|nr:Flp pilus assembly protein CpaB [Candidatus Ozemobacteraceae bacterium]
MNRRAIIVALIVSMVFSAILWKKVQQDQGKKGGEPIFVAPPKIPTKNVVVARRKIPARTMLEPAKMNEFFEIKEIVASAVPPDAFTDMASLTKKYTAITVLGGDIMTPNRMLDKDVIPALSFAVPQGKRAVTIAVTRTSGVGGFIQQGDYVDVIASFKPGSPDSITKIVMQDILVLAAGNTYAFDPGVATAAPAIAAAKMELVTLAVAPDELERLVYLDSGVIFRLVLKNPKDKGEQVQTKGATEKIVMRAIGYSEPTPAPVQPPIEVTKPVAPPAQQVMETYDTGRVEIMYGSRRHFEMNKFGMVSVTPSMKELPPVNPPVPAGFEAPQLPSSPENPAVPPTMPLDSSDASRPMINPIRE